MKKTVFAVLALVGLSLSTAACAPQPSYDANGNPVAQSGNNDALMAGAGGFLLGRMLSSGSGGSTHTTRIERHYYNNTPRRSVYRSGFSRRSSFGSSRSYSSSFGRSSGFGRRR